MVSAKLANLKPDYQNGEDNIGRDLIEPCLEECIRYRRGTGFFSATALNAYVGSLDRLISGKTKIEIICSPKINSKETIEILSRNSTDAERKKTIESLRDEIVLLAIGYPFKVKTLLEATPEEENKARREEFQYRCKLLAFFIASNVIEIKIAIPRDFSTLEIRDDKLYHVKNGYFTLPNDECVAFEGSVNESSDGHANNIDSAQVFRSWVEEDKGRLKRVQQRLDEDWEGTKYIEVMSLSPRALEIIRKTSPAERPKRPKTFVSSSEDDKADEPTPGGANKELEAFLNGLRDYQVNALKEWSAANHRGILQMATGTGKTRTALAAILAFRQQHQDSLVVVTAPYQALASQWILELRKQKIPVLEVFDSRDKWETKAKNILYALSCGATLSEKPAVFVCVNKTFRAGFFQEMLQWGNLASRSNLLIVDECHHFNDEKAIKALPPLFDHRMGLSATPYEELEPHYLEMYFGDFTFEFPLTRAIKEKYLAPYRYHPIFIQLTPDEASQYAEISRTIRRKVSDGAQVSQLSMSGEEVSSRQRMILDSAIGKMVALKKVLETEGRSQYNLFYCGIGSLFFDDGTKVRNLTSVTKMLHDLSWRVGRITAEESASERDLLLDDLRNGRLDAIVSIRVLDEGIDVPDCRKAYILASQNSQRQGIQRRGRVLRLSPGKEVADIYDFIFTGPFFADSDNDKLYERELKRAKMFSVDALNSDQCLSALRAEFGHL